MSNISLDIPDITVVINHDVPSINLYRAAITPDITVAIQNDVYSVNLQRPEIVSDVESNYYRVADYATISSTASFAQTASFVYGASTSWNILTDKPDGIVSSSAQINTGSFTGSFKGDGAGLINIPTSSTSQIISAISGSTINPASVQGNDFKITTGNVSVVFTGSIKTGLFGVSAYIDPYISMAEYSGVTIDYMATRQGAARMGIIMATWSGSMVSYTDVSSADVGDTTDIAFIFLQFGNQIRLRANSNGSGSGAWTIQSLFRLFPNVGF